MKILLFGDENFSFANGFLAEHEDDDVEICSCLKENELKQESKNNVQALNKNVVIHYGINPVQLKSYFQPNTYDALYYLLPGLSFHGHPEFIDPQTEMFKLRLNLFCFSFLKSSKNIVKSTGYVYLLFPMGTGVDSNICENELHNLKNNNLPFLPIEPNKLAKFCNLGRDKSKDFPLNLSTQEKWVPVLFNMPIVNEIPEWIKNCKYFCFRMTENDIKSGKTQKGNSNGNTANGNTNVSANSGNAGREKSEDLDKDKECEQNENNAQFDNNKYNDAKGKSEEFGGEQNKEKMCFANNEEGKENEETEEDPDEYNVLKIPPQVFDYPIEKLGHVNECFHFKLFSVNSKSVLISRLTLKYDPRISGWKGDNKVKKDTVNMPMNMNMNVPMNIPGGGVPMNMGGMNNMNNMVVNNFSNINKFKVGGKLPKGNKTGKSDFQQLGLKNNMMKNIMKFPVNNKKGNICYPPPPPSNMNMNMNMNIPQNNLNVMNQNISCKQQSNTPFVNNFKNMPNNMPQTMQSNMANIPVNVAPNMPNNIMNPYLIGTYHTMNNNANNNYRNSMYAQNVPVPPPMGNFNKKMFSGHNNNIKGKNDIGVSDSIERSYENYNSKDNYKWEEDNNTNHNHLNINNMNINNDQGGSNNENTSNHQHHKNSSVNSGGSRNNHMNRRSVGYEDCDFDYVDNHNSMNQRMMHNVEDPDYYFFKNRGASHEYGNY